MNNYIAVKKGLRIFSWGSESTCQRRNAKSSHYYSSQSGLGFPYSYSKCFPMRSSNPRVISSGKLKESRVR